jgi:muramoyltetrapeptide carboxypeptidase
LILKPYALKAGDKVAVIAPSSAAEIKNVNDAEKRIKASGLEPVMYPTCYTRYGHLSAPDAERARDINEAFSDDAIKGIICLRGGYGTPRILGMIDYKTIKSNPKVFIGYSDITALHCAFNKICRMVTFHGPMAATEFGKVQEDTVSFEKYTYDSLVNVIFKSEPIGKFMNPGAEDLKPIHGGKCEGELIGGNLTMLVSTLGSPYEVDAKGRILFIEEVDEPVYKIDRMLNSLALAGKFRDCEGIILGTFTNCIREKKSYENGYDLPLEEVIDNTIVPFGKPVIANLMAGHNLPQPTLPFGTHVKIDADKRIIIFSESATR